MRGGVRVLAIVVTYYPDAARALPLIETLGNQVDEVLVVDNTPRSGEDLLVWAKPLFAKRLSLRMVRFGENLGIAKALNLGISVAISDGFTHVLLSDQDSLPSPTMVRGLLQAETNVRARGLKVAAVGPVYVDELTGVEYPFQVQKRGKLFYESRFATDGNPDVEALSLITSGSLIGVGALRAIGGMLEYLFIDHVDVEWCLRATSLGYVNVGTRRAVLHHHMGDSCLRVWCFGWRNISGYGPIRLYYRFRNFIHIIRLPYIPLSWKIRSSWYWLGSLYGEVFFGERKVRSLLGIFYGIRDGLGGVRGVARQRLIERLSKD